MMTPHPAASSPRVGAELTNEGVVYRVWAADHEDVSVMIVPREGDQRIQRLGAEADGFFAGIDRAGRAGDRYWFRCGERKMPDPASRFQPEGVEGCSEVIDPFAYTWRANTWKRPPLRGRVIYELHIGTFTKAGTFAAAMEQLDALADLGVNTIELMPVGDFIGRWNWGYDGVMLFAPARCYGRPEELRALVDAAHARGLAVVLDVVYNHLGPIGNVLPSYARDYFHHTRENPWGTSLNFDGKNSGPVRAFFLQNVAMWLDEFRIDGLRLDAVHAIEDASPQHIIAEIAAAAQQRGAFVIAEDERNEAMIVTSRERGGWGADGLWSDDFHHSLRVALTGERQVHYANFDGSLAQRLATLRDGWFYRGQEYPGWKRPRGTNPDALAPEQFVFCISNHDQVGNRPLGDRLHQEVTPAAYRAASMLLCFVPQTPMLFMGQEWAASSPFPFFTDLPGEIGEKMAGYRIAEFESRGGAYPPELLARMPDPQAESTFRGAKLDWTERSAAPHAGVLALHRACLRCRAEHAIFQSAPKPRWSATAANARAMSLRWHDDGGDWQLVVTLESAGDARTANVPLGVAGAGGAWHIVLASEETRFGGAGAPVIDGAGGVALPGPGAVLLRAADKDA